MKKIVGLGLLVLVFLVSCAGKSQQMDQKMDHKMTGGMGDHMSAIANEYEFLREMVPHHEEAVSSALLVIKNTKRTELKDFSQEIVDAQAKEILDMKTWLKEWYPNLSSKANYRGMMRPTVGFSSERADQSFLEDMIMHHRMAVMMARNAIANNLTQRPELKVLLNNIIASQNAEIEQMEIWLKDWYGVANGHMGQRGSMQH